MFSISLASCEVKENLEDAKNLVDEINDLVGDLGSDSSLSFNEAEHHILEGTRALGQKWVCKVFVPIQTFHIRQRLSLHIVGRVSVPPVTSNSQTWRGTETPPYNG